MARWSKQDDSSVVLHFGKHNGTKLHDVPDSYLRWMEESFDDDEELLDEIQEELRWRDSTGTVIKDD